MFFPFPIYDGDEDEDEDDPTLNQWEIRNTYWTKCQWVENILSIRLQPAKVSTIMCSIFSV
jgi:hypothetical protein